MDSHRRQQLLADAKKLGKPDEGRNIDITIKESFRRATASTSSLTRPAISAKKGSTKHYKRFNIDEEPLIGEFMKNLASFDGGKRSLPEVRQIASDVSKFLAYAFSTKCTWECYRNIQSIKNYAQRLQDDRIGSDGMTTKLDRIETGLKYACREGKIHLSSDEFQMISGRLSQWKKTFRREKPSLQIARNIRGSDENHENIVERVTEVLENSRMKTIMESIQHKATPSNEDTNFFVT